MTINYLMSLQLQYLRNVSYIGIGYHGQPQVFPLFTIFLDADLGSLLHGDVSLVAGVRGISKKACM